jgi:hypothetical protein
VWECVALPALCLSLLLASLRRKCFLIHASLLVRFLHSLPTEFLSCVAVDHSTSAACHARCSYSKIANTYYAPGQCQQETRNQQGTVNWNYTLERDRMHSLWAKSSCTCRRGRNETPDTNSFGLTPTWNCISNGNKRRLRGRAPSRSPSLDGMSAHWILSNWTNSLMAEDIMILEPRLCVYLCRRGILFFQ